MKNKMFEMPLRDCDCDYTFAILNVDDEIIEIVGFNDVPDRLNNPDKDEIIQDYISHNYDPCDDTIRYIDFNIQDVSVLTDDYEVEER